MKFGKHCFVLVCMIVSAALIVQLAGCGTIFYPERRGQTTGRVDIGIAILDAAWLLVFIIPGVVAFGVDFSTGAIYLPSGRHKSITPDAERMAIIKLDPKELNARTIEEAVRRHTGCPTALCLSNAETYPVADINQMAALLAEHRVSGYDLH
jgi:hypothetical protein